MARVVVAIVLAVVAAAGASLVAPAGAELTRVEHPPKTEGSLNILAVGDWGRRGQYNQTLVAEQVIKLSLRLICLACVFTAGKNGGMLSNPNCTFAYSK